MQGVFALCVVSEHSLMLMLAVRSQGKYTEADPLYLRAIDIRERVLGADHPELAISLCTRGQLLQAQVCVCVRSIFSGASLHTLRYCVDCDVSAGVTQKLLHFLFWFTAPPFPLAVLAFVSTKVQQIPSLYCLANKSLSTAKSQANHSQ